MEALKQRDRREAKRLVIILNDNKWSIAKNVGALPRYFFFFFGFFFFNELITNPVYNRLNNDLEAFLQKMPGRASRSFSSASKWKRETKDFFVSSSLFETYGIRYIASDRRGTTSSSSSTTSSSPSAPPSPCFLHVAHDQGQGLRRGHSGTPERLSTGPAPSTFKTGKGARPPRPARRRSTRRDGRGPPGQTARCDDRRVVGITAAMPSGNRPEISSKRNCPSSFSTSVICRGACRSFFRRRHGHRRLPPGLPRSTRPSSSAPTTRSFTTSPCKTCPCCSAWTAAGLSPNDGRHPLTGSSTSATCAACERSP